MRHQGGMQRETALQTDPRSPSQSLSSRGGGPPGSARRSQRQLVSPTRLPLTGASSDSAPSDLPEQMAQRLPKGKGPCWELFHEVRLCVESEGGGGRTACTLLWKESRVSPQSLSHLFHVRPWSFNTRVRPCTLPQPRAELSPRPKPPRPQWAPPYLPLRPSKQ